IQGDGFFVVNNAGQQLFTRNGSFSFDANGSLVSTDGSVVQGWTANATGAVNTNAATGPISLPLSTLLPPKATANMTVAGNLPADTTNPNPIVTSITTYDVQGNPVTTSASFTKVNPNQWTVNLSDGVNKAGDSEYRTTANSGNAQLGTAGAAGRGVLQQGALEMSNVDLSQEFTNLVIAERGFQANSRVITTSDEILQDLVNIKH